MGPYQRTPKKVTRAIKYPGLGVRSVGPVGDFLEICKQIFDSPCHPTPSSSHHGRPLPRHCISEALLHSRGSATIERILTFLRSLTACVPSSAVLDAFPDGAEEGDGGKARDHEPNGGVPLVPHSCFSIYRAMILVGSLVESGSIQI